MNWVQVPLDGVPPQLWRNGGGTTRELLAWPDTTNWRVRVSVADITQDGPFSRFHDIERWFAVLEGAGVRLRVESDEHVLDTGSAPLRFAGSASTESWLVGGPTRDFNLMARPGAATMWRVEGAMERSVAAGTLVGAYAHAAPARVVAQGEAWPLAPRVFAWQQMAEPADLRIEGGGVLWLEVLT